MMSSKREKIEAQPQQLPGWVWEADRGPLRGGDNDTALRRLRKAKEGTGLVQRRDGSCADPRPGGAKSKRRLRRGQGLGEGSPLTDTRRYV